MKEREEILSVSEQSIAEYVYTQLLEYGYAPESDEVLDIAEIVFDFLLGLNIFEVIAVDMNDGEEED